jgi:hypothetical protein
MSTSESEKKGLRNRKQKEQDAPEKGKQDKGDEKKQHGTTKDKKQGDTCNADKHNETGQKTSIQSKGCPLRFKDVLIAVFICVIILTVAVAGGLAYTDLATRQSKVLDSVNELRRDVEEIKELKSHLGDVVRNCSADEIKILKNVERSVTKIEKGVKALKS